MTLSRLAKTGAYVELMRRDRERLGLSIGEAAWLLKIKPWDYQRLEEGEGRPSIDQVERMYELFGWS